MAFESGQKHVQPDWRQTLSNPPLSDELEVSVFGPGKGESIVIHLGDGRWIIVDSCIDQRSGSIPPLQYLSDLGVDVSTQVELVVATHAHNDHFAGIARVYEACALAKFVWPMAATSEEFAAFVELDDLTERSLRKSAYSEYRAVMRIADDRQAGSGGQSQMKHAIQDRVILKHEKTESAPKMTVLSLSPSDSAVTRAQKYHSEQLYKLSPHRRVVAIDPNYFAVALWIQCGDTSILLGADLTNGPQGCGWETVLRTHNPAVSASFFKIPHHGSPNSHLDEVWSDLLAVDPVSVVTPFRGSVTPRPSPDDVRRIKQKTKRAFATASTSTPARSKSTKATATALQGLASNVRDVWGSVGQVRSRLKSGSDRWDVEVTAPAFKL
jgi:beta-lactamase superfamily II metal-dependent hydrolase